MNVFVFKPSNEFICKFRLTNIENIQEEALQYLVKYDLPENSYLEAAGRRWTIVGSNPFQLQEGLTSSPTVSPEPMQQTISAPKKRSMFARCAIWSGVLTIAVPLMWAAITESLGATGHHNAALMLGWAGVLPIILGVPIGIVVTIGLTIAAVIQANANRVPTKTNNMSNERADHG